jgi:hypothetical protein
VAVAFFWQGNPFGRVSAYDPTSVQDSEGIVEVLMDLHSTTCQAVAPACAFNLQAKIGDPQGIVCALSPVLSFAGRAPWPHQEVATMAVATTVPVWMAGVRTCGFYRLPWRA